MTVTIPALRTIVTPVEGDTRADRVEAMRVLSAGNTIIVVILAGVLLLQVRPTFTWVGPFFDSYFSTLAGRGRICQASRGKGAGENN